VKVKLLPLIILAFLLAACNGTVAPKATPVPEQITLPVKEGVAVGAQHTPAASTAGPTPTPAYWAEGDAYTIAWISDPQYYAKEFPEIYLSMTRFLAREQEKMNLRYVICTGDIVDDNSEVYQWEAARAAWDLLADIPYGVLAGNHDMEKTRGGWELYEEYFGEAKFAGLPHYGGSYKNNRGHYDLLDIGGTAYLFVYMSHNIGRAEIRWLNETFRAYPDRVGILCVHDYFMTDGTRSETGQRLFEEVVATNPNIYMVLCGHRYGIYNVPETLEGGRTVWQMMMNYQAAGDFGGSGYLRLMQVREDKGVIHVMTYSPWLDEYNMLKDDRRTLSGRGELMYDMDADSEAFVMIIPWR